MKSDFLGKCYEDLGLFEFDEFFGVFDYFFYKK